MSIAVEREILRTEVFALYFELEPLAKPFPCNPCKFVAMVPDPDHFHDLEEYVDCNASEKIFESNLVDSRVGDFVDHPDHRILRQLHEC